MARRFTPTEKQELHALLGVTSPEDVNALVDRGPVPIAEVRRILGLPELPHAHLLAEDTWLLGGRVVRWLNGEMRGGSDDGDYDFYCGSLAALERTARRMLDDGYTFCRREGPKLRRKWLGGRVGPLIDAHASCCLPDPESLTLREHLQRRLRKMPDGREMYVLPFHSPEGHELQLVHTPSLFREGVPVRNQIAYTDLSICQFTLDNRFLHAGPHSWVDLFEHRVRAVSIVRPDFVAGRLLKYARRGFWPRWESIQRVRAALRARRQRQRSEERR